MKSVIVATALAFGFAGSAMAADAMVEDVVVVDSTYNWSGVYVGGQVGYAFGNADYVYDPDSPDPDYDYANDPDGFIGGLYVGYNHQFANGVVLGGEADFAFGNVEDSDLAPGDDTYSASTEIDWTGAARVRFGYAFDRFLPYVAGGVAFGHYDFEELNNGDDYGDHDGGLVGWTIGLGAEYAFTDNWIVRGEYRYTDFGKENFISNHSDDEYDIDVDIHDVRIGVAYKF
ncbi:outer membrane protein [Mesorhizobium sp. ZMM04-5]|uniref:Outer membrane protein n=1 Tax=Mesorhizobium marinum TaxID=3228790 RepID=A0ABV3R327_9HYPH